LEITVKATTAAMIRANTSTRSTGTGSNQ